MHALLLSLAILAGTLFGEPAAAADRYAPGQVWEYAARRQDQGSLIKIQRIDRDARGSIYHISMIGIRIGSDVQQVQHLPVSRETLDASVTRLSDSKAEFPDPSEGIAEWQRAKGGVFTITLAEIAGMLEKMLKDAREDTQPAT